MFVITADVKIGNYKAFKPTSLAWKRDVDTFTDTGSIKLPAACMLKKSGDQYERLQTGLQFSEGMKAEFYGGYNGRNDLRFKGFVSRINYTVPVEIECEGYSYQLRKKVGYTKSYKNTTVINILNDLIEGTDIKLSPDIPHIPIKVALFDNINGTQVLEWFKSKCLLTAYFTFDTLYVGLQQTEPKTNVKLRLGWNVIKDSELKFNNKKEFAEVRIELGCRKKNGEKQKAFSGKKDGQVKRLRTAISDPESMAKIAEQARQDFINRGYEGGLTLFLWPIINPGDAGRIEDTKYIERTGRYFVTGIEGSISKSGGRVKVKIGNSLGG